MLALILLVLSIGLADAVNPSTVAPALVLVTGPGGAQRLGRFTLGVFVVSLVGGIALLLGPGQLLLDALPHPSAHAKHLGEAFGGVVLLALAVALWIGRHRVAASMAAAGDSDRLERGAFALGAGIMAVELPTALPYFAAIAAVIAADVPLLVRIALVALYNVAFVAPLLALLVARERLGERGTARLDALGARLRERGPALLAGLLAVLGVAVGLVGVIGLS